MGKETGFLEYDRKNNEYVPVKERIRNYDELYRRLPEEERRRQGARCMNCGVPFCQSAINLGGMVTGCPLHNLIPEWNDLLYRGDMRHALQRLVKTSSFPEFTGRVCPALCEKACILGMIEEPVTTHDNELFLIETGFKKGWMQPRIPAVRSGKKVAVIGSGPAGLAAADQLNQRGHSVTVFERDDRIGGLLMYGIPNQKLPKDVVKRRQELMEKEGVTFMTGVDVGRTLAAEEILKSFDAVALCCGAKQPRAVQAVNMDKAKGVIYAVDFLSSTTKSLLNDGLKEGSYVSAKGQDVVIVGGGDTGNDCVGTCIRHGARSVVQLEMMPCPPSERREDNPWPQWPKVLKTDYGQLEAEGVFGKDPRIYETTIKELVLDKTGSLTHVVTARVHFKDGKMETVEGSEKKIPCTLLIIAAGFTGAQIYTANAFGIGLDKRSRVLTEEGTYHVVPAGKEDVKKLFTAGDMRRGQSLVVWAIAEGREMAKEVDAFLMGI